MENLQPVIPCYIYLRIKEIYKQIIDLEPDQKSRDYKIDYLNNLFFQRRDDTPREI